jgi:hypothetical protein
MNWIDFEKVQSDQSLSHSERRATGHSYAVWAIGGLYRDRYRCATFCVPQIAFRFSRPRAPTLDSELRGRLKSRSRHEKSDSVNRDRNDPEK